jgi:hypothetical protein
MQNQRFLKTLNSIFCSKGFEPPFFLDFMGLNKGSVFVFRKLLSADTGLAVAQMCGGACSICAVSNVSRNVSEMPYGLSGCIGGSICESKSIK